MLDADQVAPLSSAQETLLQKQEITREAPSSILRDIDTMLDLVGDGGLRVSESRGAIYAKRLSEINEQLTRSLEADYKRLTQKAFPTIAGLNLLLRAAALVRIDRTGTHPRMERNEDIVASWTALNPTEQYVSLLEAWLNRADEEAIFDDSGAGGMGTLAEVLQLIQDIPPTGWDLSFDDRRGAIRYWPGYPGLALMRMFGLVEIEERPRANPGKSIASSFRPSARRSCAGWDGPSTRKARQPATTRTTPGSGGPTLGRWSSRATISNVCSSPTFRRGSDIWLAPTPIFVPSPTSLPPSCTTSAGGAWRCRAPRRWMR